MNHNEMNRPEIVKYWPFGVALVSARQHKNSVFIGEIEIDSSPGRAKYSVTIGDYNVFKVTEPKYFQSACHAQYAKESICHVVGVGLVHDSLNS